MSFHVEYGIICDVVRREESGKLILLGTYARDIIVKTFPVKLLICCVVVAAASAAGTFEIEFRVLFDGKSKIEGKGPAHLDRPGRVMLPIQNILLDNLTQPGVLSFEAREVGQKDWQPVTELPVVLI